MIKELLFTGTLFVSVLGQIPTNHQSTFEILQDGRVVTFNFSTGVYSSICSESWDDADATVICRSHGLSNVGFAKTLPRNWTLNREIYGIHCNGTEINTSDCAVDKYDTSYGVCDTLPDAAIDCFANQRNGRFKPTIEGRVMYIENGTEYTICSHDWDDVDASVLCRDLGLGTSGTAKYLQRDWRFMRTYSYGIYCSGNEQNMLDCPYNNNDMTYGMCDNMDDAAVVCHDERRPGMLEVTAEGRVLYIENGSVQTICSHDWDDVDASVLCRHMGLGMSGRAKYLQRDWTFIRSKTYGIYCNGAEINALDCPYNENDTTHGMCDTMDDAAVECDGGEPMFVQPDGRLIQMRNGTMETICSYDWDDTDASVMCRHLGLGMSGRATYLPRDWAFGRADVYGIYCLGNETDKNDCHVNEHDITQGMCTGMDDAGIQCDNGRRPGMLEVTPEGRVLYIENGSVQTICSHDWDDVDASVLCRHMGLGMSGRAKYLQRDWTFIRSKTYGIYCNGAEINALDCPYNENDTTHGMCDTMDDAAVECDGGEPMFVQPDGRLIQMRNGTMETICSYDWDDADASVMCRHLGLGMSGRATYLPRDWTLGRADVYGIYCLGNETDKNDCHVNEHDITQGMCTGMDDAGIQCENGRRPGMLEVTPEGRVLYIENGSVQTICSHDWDDVDASVLCRHMGLGMSGRAKYLQRDWTFIRSKTYGIYCNGAEINALDCPYNENDTTHGMCDTMDDAAVECDGGEPMFVQPDGRLIQMRNGTMETICSYDWDDADASVMCRHLGLGMSGRATYLPRDWALGRADVYGIYCLGYETDKNDCHVNEHDITQGMCTGMDDAGIQCDNGRRPGMLEVTPEGRVLYIENGSAQTICSHDWDDVDASVLCRHMGLGMSGRAKYLQRDWTFIRSKTYGIYCNGAEINALDCPYNENDTTHGMCDTMDDAAVECDGGEPMFVQPDGRLIQMRNGTMETICSYDWDDGDASVMCRHLGLGMSGRATYLPRDWTFGRADVYGIYCLGNETDKNDCHVNEHDITQGMCSGMDDAGIQCENGRRPGMLEVTPEGRVLYIENGSVQTICSHDWDDVDASVLCRHMGLGMSGRAKYLQRDWTFIRSKTYGIYCNGAEINALDCPYNENDTTHGMCDTMDDAAVECDGGEPMFVQPDGRLIQMRNGTMETICSYDWDDADASVMCRHLGLGMSGRATYLPRDWALGRADVYGIYCLGNETDKNDCHVNEHDITQGMCTGMDDAGIQCDNGRRPGMLEVTPEGRVLYIENGSAQTICSHDWDDVDASVLCRHMGLGMSGRAKYLQRDWTFIRSKTYGIYCNGAEINALDCPYNENDTTHGMCDTMDDAAVECDGGEPMFVQPDGRLIQMRNGTMETICSYDWDDGDASVMCRHLGLGMSGRATYLPRDWTFGRADVYGIYCLGNETDKNDCHVNEHDITQGMCSGMDDAGIQCENGRRPGMLEVTPEGRVLYIENGSVQTICSHDWDDVDASVLCRHMGLGMSGRAKYLQRDWTFIRSKTYGIYCNGAEINALDCPYNENDTTHGMCDTMDDAAVECDGGEPMFVQPDGRLIQMRNGTMETICSYDWDDADASVMCRHLGLGMSGRATYLPRDWALGRADVYGIYCLGNETDKNDCHVNEHDITQGMCTGMDDAGIQCDNGRRPGMLEVTPEGRVLYIENGSAQTICSHDWDDVDASVLCRHMGLGMSGRAKYLQRDWTFIRSKTYGIYCNGAEINALDCPYNENDTTHGMCDTMDDAAVECDGGEPMFVQPDGRLIQMRNGTMETICSYDWDDGDASVMCRHLGLGMSGRATYLPRDWTFGRADVYGIYCLGNETDKNDCHVNEHDITQGMCTGMDDAGIQCENGRRPGILEVTPEGRVLYIENGSAQTICSHDWDDVDASILCRHMGLGMSGRAKYLQRDWTFIRSKTYGIYCNGAEINALDCPYNENDTTHGMCDTMDDAAVECDGGEPMFVQPDGRLIQMRNGTMETICSYDWDDGDASVMCRHLGLGMSGRATYLPRDWALGRADVYGIYCLGNETDKNDCHVNEHDITQGMCSGMDDAGIQCDNGRRPGMLEVTPEGRVLYIENGSVQTICSHDWDDVDASVLCRHMGLGMSGRAKYLQRDWTFIRSKTYGIYCNGAEINALDCPYNENDTTHGMCDTMEDAAVECDGGEPMFVQPDGRLIQMRNGTMETICSYDWDDGDASVMCRHLGLGMSGRATYLPRDWALGRADVYGIYCLGNETDKNDCHVNEHDITQGMCSGMDDAGIQCDNGRRPGMLEVTPEGRVLYIENGSVQTICSHDWDDVDASVLCRHMGLGMSGRAKYLQRDWTFIRSKTYGIYCNGAEINALDCPYNENDTTHGMCDTMEDAAVECDGGEPMFVQPDGRLIQMRNGTMETICSYDWDDGDASVMCRHLGLGMSGRATYLPRDWALGRADVYGIYCLGNETDNNDCHVNEHDITQGMCSGMDDAGIQCDNGRRPGMLEVTPEGRVLYIENGSVQTICSHDWDDVDASVLCRHMGLGMSGRAKYLQRDWTFIRSKTYGIYCNGAEINALDCPYNENDTTHGMCDTMEDAAVECDGGEPMFVQPDGRLIQMRNGTMETICSYDWDDGDASVMCRHLGLGMSGRATYLPRDWALGRADVYGIYCLGNETDKNDCHVNEHDITQGMCSGMDDAGIQCDNGRRPGMLEVTPEGRVLYIENGSVQTICSHDWDDVDASVLCRHMGLGMSGRAKYLQRDWTFIRSKTYGIYCNGAEINALDCPYNENDTTHGMCDTMEDAAVECDGGEPMFVQPDGRLIQMRNGTMETICSYDWDDGDASVMCRHLGLGMSGRATYLPRDWALGRADVYGIYCLGNETDKNDCHVNEHDITQGMCSGMDDAGIQCDNGRRPGMLEVTPEGRVLYIENGSVQTICSHDWDDVDASVLCRHMGLGMSGRAKYLQRDWTFIRSKTYGIYCNGAEINALDCPYNENDTTHGMCDTMEDAAVECDGGEPMFVQPDGRLIQMRNGTMETICSYDWDDGDASVMCRHLGLGMSGRATYLPRDWALGRADVYGIYCLGNETDKNDCHVNEHDITQGMCSGMDDAGIQCDNGRRPGMLEVTPEGRVLYIENGSVQTICSHDWDDVDASVLCRHMGLGMSGRAKYLQRDWTFIRSKTYGIYCNGAEINALDCPYNENDTTHGMCDTMEDAAVECDGGEPMFVQPDGRLIQMRNGTMETICSYDWDDGDASVMCRHLGLGMSGRATYLPRDWAFGRADVYGIYCLGNETDKNDCHVNEHDITQGMCSGMDDAGIQCDNGRRPGMLEVTPEGRVLYIENGSVQTICSHDWDDVDASVLCRHMGLGMSGRAKYLQRDWTFIRSKTYGIYCNGAEINALDCPYNENDTTHGMCDTMEDAAVDCDGGEPMFVQPDGRLIQMRNGTMETICSYDWDDGDASVMCRHLGLGMSGRATYLPRDWAFGRADVYGIYCLGNETDKNDCHVNEHDITQGMCSGMDDAGIQCDSFNSSANWTIFSSNGSMITIQPTHTVYPMSSSLSGFMSSYPNTIMSQTVYPTMAVMSSLIHSSITTSSLALHTHSVTSSLSHSYTGMFSSGTSNTGIPMMSSLSSSQIAPSVSGHTMQQMMTSSSHFYTGVSSSYTGIPMMSSLSSSQIAPSVSGHAMQQMMTSSSHFYTGVSSSYTGIPMMSSLSSSQIAPTVSGHTMQQMMTSSSYFHTGVSSSYTGIPMMSSLSNSQIAPSVSGQTMQQMMTSSSLSYTGVSSSYTGIPTMSSLSSSQIAPSLSGHTMQQMMTSSSYFHTGVSSSYTGIPMMSSLSSSQIAPSPSVSGQTMQQMMTSSSYSYTGVSSSYTGIPMMSSFSSSQIAPSVSGQTMQQMMTSSSHSYTGVSSSYTGIPMMSSLSSSQIAPSPSVSGQTMQQMMTSSSYSYTGVSSSYTGIPMMSSLSSSQIAPSPSVSGQTMQQMMTSSSYSYTGVSSSYTGIPMMSSLSSSQIAPSPSVSGQTMQQMMTSSSYSYTGVSSSYTGIPMMSSLSSSQIAASVSGHTMQQMMTSSSYSYTGVSSSYTGIPMMSSLSSSQIAPSPSVSGQTMQQMMTSSSYSYTGVSSSYTGIPMMSSFSSSQIAPSVSGQTMQQMMTSSSYFHTGVSSSYTGRPMMSSLSSSQIAPSPSVSGQTMQQMMTSSSYSYTGVSSSYTGIHMMSSLSSSQIAPSVSGHTMQQMMTSSSYFHTGVSSSYTGIPMMSSFSSSQIAPSVSGQTMQQMMTSSSHSYTGVSSSYTGIPMMSSLSSSQIVPSVSGQTMQQMMTSSSYSYTGVSSSYTGIPMMSSLSSSQIAPSVSGNTMQQMMTSSSLSYTGVSSSYTGIPTMPSQSGFSVPANSMLQLSTSTVTPSVNLALTSVSSMTTTSPSSFTVTSPNNAASSSYTPNPSTTSSPVNSVSTSASYTTSQSFSSTTLSSVTNAPTTSVSSNTTPNAPSSTTLSSVTNAPTTYVSSNTTPNAPSSTTLSSVTNAPTTSVSSNTTPNAPSSTTLSSVTNAPTTSVSSNTTPNAPSSTTSSQANTATTTDSTSTTQSLVCTNGLCLANNLGAGGSSVWTFYSWKMLIFSIVVATAITNAVFGR